MWHEPGNLRADKPPTSWPDNGYHAPRRVRFESILDVVEIAYLASAAALCALAAILLVIELAREVF